VGGRQHLLQEPLAHARRTQESAGPRQQCPHVSPSKIGYLASGALRIGLKNDGSERTTQFLGFMRRRGTCVKGREGGSTTGGSSTGGSSTGGSCSCRI